MKEKGLSFLMTKSFLVGPLLAASLLLSTSGFTTAEAQLTKLNVASSGISPTQIVPYIAQEAGIYAKNGLDVAIIRARAEIAVMSLLGGDTPLIQIAGTPIIRSSLKGRTAKTGDSEWTLFSLPRERWPRIIG
jgi:ABC-type nitrate/sulfonate/bicarbonate transport system substrate-binding protein